MRQTLSRGMVAAAAATGILSLCGSPVFADSNADSTAAGSPGVASGNTVQVPVNIPVNLCGNTVDVIAALNPAFGNTCANGTGVQTPEEENPAVPEQPPGDSTGTNTPGGSTTTPDQNGDTPGTQPGVNEAPPTETVDTPQIGTPVINTPSTSSHTTPALAETGSEGLLAASAVSVAMLAGGLILYRRGRVTSHR
ncbi:chaplin [Streptomyces sp. NPDC046984]|uniref:chaplin n=1 Tax=unclassified Streptomyces TaxID=2593676 RepID=UPI0033D23719